MRQEQHAITLVSGSDEDNSSPVVVLVDSSESTGETQIDPDNLRKLAEVKENLQLLRQEITQKISSGVKDCRKSCRDVNALLEEMNDVLRKK